MNVNIQSFNINDNSSNSKEEENYFLQYETEEDIYDDEIAKNDKENPWRKSYYDFFENKNNKTLNDTY